MTAVASWQASETRDARMPAPGARTDGFAKLIKAQITAEIGKFSTRNPQNTRKLLQLVGYDPRSYLVDLRRSTRKHRVEADGR